MKRALIRAAALLLICALTISSALAYTKLEKGMEGSEVLSMQLALQSLGYTLKTDGKYGPATVTVVKSFQRKHGLTADGVAGNQTLTLLYQLAPSYEPSYSFVTQAPMIAPTAAPQFSSGDVAMVTTPGGSLNLREEANSGARVITAIPNGEKVVVLQRGSSWSSVVYDGMAGYVLTKYLSSGSYTPPTAAPTPLPTTVPAVAPTAFPASVQALVVTTGGSLNLRERADSAARVITTIPYGTWVTVTARGSSWCAVNYNGQNGYVMSQYLSFGAAVPTAAPTALPTIAPTVAPQPVFGETAYVSTTGGSLNLRESPDGGARVVATVPNGTALTILSRGDLWCAVSYQGMAGYVMTSFLRFTSVQPTSVPTVVPTQPPMTSVYIGYVTTSGGSLNLREAAKSSAKVLTTIPNGTALMVSERGSVWSAVTYNGVYGYVMTSFLSFPGIATAAPTAAPTPAPTAQGITPSSGTGLITTSGGGLNLRAEASSSAKVLSTIPNAAIVTVHARGEEWSRVTYNGATGWVMTKYLTFLNGAAPTADPNGEEDDPSAFTRILKKGMTGADVTWAQNRLLELGYSLTVTNVYDDATFAAVKAFQTQNGLTADGLAGSQTFALLKSDSARKAGSAPLTYSTLRIDNSGDGVRQIQTDLKNLGYNVTVNGSYDVNTHNAVVAFQQRNGLVISGIADSLTRQVLHGGGGKPYSTPVEALPANEGWIQGPAVSQLKLLHWQNEIKPTVKAGQTFTVFDPNTHLSWKLVFYSLGRHADSQPASWRDTQIMNRSFGGTSWTIHPVYVQLPSGQWTLATMHNRPHLYGTIADNGFGGHLCVHFLRDMAEAQKNDPNYGVNNQVTLRNAWKALTGETVD